MISVRCNNNSNTAAPIANATATTTSAAAVDRARTPARRTNPGIFTFAA
ncbi:hypothetical protein GCM10009554_10520 [Kribbella koreensis]|uniref:Uncharacterized protein n=1 Tax=Kribbella koreensis TaxID=57909 RepID=A0ABP3ZXQ7_9ACTN